MEGQFKGNFSQNITFILFEIIIVWSNVTHFFLWNSKHLLFKFVWNSLEKALNKSDKIEKITWIKYQHWTKTLYSAHKNKQLSVTSVVEGSRWYLVFLFIGYFIYKKELKRMKEDRRELKSVWLFSIQ